MPRSSSVSVRHEADAEVVERLHDLALHVPRPERILRLEGRDGMLFVCRSNRVGRRLREAEVTHLALLHKPPHRAHRVLDRDLRIDAVEIVEIDRVHAEALKRVLAGALDVARPAVDALIAAVLPAHDAKLRGDGHCVLMRPQDAPHQLLVGEGAVHVGGVEEGDAAVNGTLERLDGPVLVGRAVKLRHPHTAEAEGGDGEVVLAERPLLREHKQGRWKDRHRSISDPSNGRRDRLLQPAPSQPVAPITAARRTAASTTVRPCSCPRANPKRETPQLPTSQSPNLAPFTLPPTPAALRTTRPR